MEAQSLPQALNMIMEQRDCSQAQLGRDLGKGQTWVSEMIRSKRGHEFARVINILARVGWEVVIRPKRENSDPVKRREFVAAAASVMFVPSPKAGPYEDPAYVRELARRVAHTRYEHGSGAIAATAMKHIRQVEPAVMGRDHALHEAASELAIETVWTLSEAHRFNAAEQVGGLALKLARLSTSPDMQSRAYSVLAAANLKHRNADRAVRYAKDGMRLSEVSKDQQAWMRLRLARTLALVRGQEHTSRDEIENVLGRLRDSGGFYGQSEFDAADMMGCIGMALSALGAYGEAQTVLGESVALVGNSSPDLYSHFLAHQVIAALRMAKPQPALAADRMLALARVAPLVDSRRLDDDLKAIIATSAGWTTVPEIRTARDQLIGTCARDLVPDRQPARR